MPAFDRCIFGTVSPGSEPVVPPKPKITMTKDLMILALLIKTTSASDLMTCLNTPEHKCTLERAYEEACIVERWLRSHAEVM